MSQFREKLVTNGRTDGRTALNSQDPSGYTPGIQQGISPKILQSYKSKITSVLLLLNVTEECGNTTELSAFIQNYKHSFIEPEVSVSTCRDIEICSTKFMNVIISCFSINIFSKSFVRLQCIFSFLPALQTKCGIIVWLNCDRSLRRTDSSGVDFALVFFSNSSALSLQFFTVELIGTTSAFFSSSGKYFLNDSSSNDSISSVHLLGNGVHLVKYKTRNHVIHLPRRQELLNLQKNNVSLY